MVTEIVRNNDYGFPDGHVKFGTAIQAYCKQFSKCALETTKRAEIDILRFGCHGNHTGNYGS